MSYLLRARGMKSEADSAVDDAISAATRCYKKSAAITRAVSVGAVAAAVPWINPEFSDKAFNLPLCGAIKCCALAWAAESATDDLGHLVSPHIRKTTK